MRQGNVRVSVVMTTFNPRPVVLKEAVASLVAQDYPAALVEVVLVDDGSTDTLAKNGLATLEDEFASRGWRILRIPNSYLGAARNVGVKNTTGDVVMFMDDDNIAKPGELSAFVSVWRRGGDVFTCMVDEFTHKIPAHGRAKNRYLPSGNTELSWLANTLGDANFFLSRAAWDAVGPFSEDRLAFEDWEFLHKAQVLNMSLSVVPEALFWKRSSHNSMLQTADHRASTIRAFRPSFLSTDPALRTLYLYAKAVSLKNEVGGSLVVLHTVNDFSPVQGYNDLFYCFRPSGGLEADWTSLPLVELPAWAHDENDHWYSYRVDSPLAMSSTVMHASAGHDVAKVWHSRVEGVIHIMGEVSKVDAGGDGVDFSIVAGNKTVFHRFVKIKLSFKVNVYAHIKIGELVSFVAHSGKTHDNDSLWAFFSIEFDRRLREIPSHAT